MTGEAGDDTGPALKHRWCELCRKVQILEKSLAVHLCMPATELQDMRESEMNHDHPELSTSTRDWWCLPSAEAKHYLGTAVMNKLPVGCLSGGICCELFVVCLLGSLWLPGHSHGQARVW